MKKLRLKQLNLSKNDVLTRVQLRNVMGDTGSDGSSGDCPVGTGTFYSDPSGCGTDSYIYSDKTGVCVNSYQPPTSQQPCGQNQLNVGMTHMKPFTWNRLQH